jgi:hypothetical protein
VIERAGGILLRGASCRRYRPVLVDLVDRGERGPLTADALDHLVTCGACEREVTEVALTVAALRRAGTTWRAIPVPAMTRPAVPPARRRPWAWRVQLGGLITSAGIAALLVAPQVGLLPAAPQHASVDTPDRTPSASWHAAEQRIAASPDVRSTAAVGSMLARYPDGRLRPWKEVSTSDAAARGLDPQ